MAIAGLKTELTNDPLARGYASMGDADAAISLNTANRPGSAINLTGDDLMNKVIVWSEVEALTAAKRDMLGFVYQFHLLKAGNLDLTSGSKAVNYLASLFGVGTATRANFLALQPPQISRAMELGMPPIGHPDVAAARAS